MTKRKNKIPKLIKLLLAPFLALLFLIGWIAAKTGKNNSVKSENRKPLNH